MDLLACKLIVKGCLTYIPYLYDALARTTRHTQDARYCYSVWMRHYVCARDHGLPLTPESVVELGPGGSIGTGLAALLLGASQYTALDAHDHFGDFDHGQVFAEIVELVRQKASIPDSNEYTNLQPDLESYVFPQFPKEILDDEQITKRASRIERLLTRLRSERTATDQELRIRLETEWNGTDALVLPKSSVDVVFSQAVMEHADDVQAVYDAIACWLKPKGLTCHQIDFKSHQTAKEWNGHWQYSDPIWFLILGRRKYLINRHPFSSHLKMLETAGLQRVADRRVYSESKLTRNQLAKRFSNLTPTDLETSGAFIIAEKSE